MLQQKRQQHFPAYNVISVILPARNSATRQLGNFVILRVIRLSAS